MRSRVRLPPEVRRAVVAHARRDAPRECCGFLVGRGTVLAAVPMANVARSRTRYRIDDQAHIELRRTLRRFEPPLEILGVYHSHPDGPGRPSETDIREAHYHDWIYAIVNLAGARAQVGVFRMVGRRATNG